MARKQSRQVIAMAQEIARLQEALAISQSQDISPSDMGVGGRVAISRLRDTDWKELVEQIEMIPTVYKTHGLMAAYAFARNHIRAHIDSISFANPRTGDLVQVQHRVHMLLEPGFVELLWAEGRAGQLSRIEFLEVVERYFFALSVRAAFARGAETPAGLLPPGFGQRE